MTLNEEFEDVMSKHNFRISSVFENCIEFVEVPRFLPKDLLSALFIQDRKVVRMTNVTNEKCNVLFVYFKNEEQKKETIADKVIGSTHVRSKLNNQVRPIAGIKDNLVLTGEGCCPVEQCVFLKKVYYNAKLSIDTAQRGLQSGNIDIYENGKLHSKILIIDGGNIIVKNSENEYLIMNKSDFNKDKYTMLFHRFEQVWPVPF